MNDLELQTADRLLSGIEQISEAVHRLNELGKTIRIAPIAIRFSPSPLIHGDNAYHSTVNKFITEEYARRLQVQIGQEHERRARRIEVEEREEVAA